MNNLQHLAVIMDGNGRWAKRRALLRTDGHKRGSEVIDLLCEFCLENSVKTLTLYAFSTENWSRPKAEVGFLLKLLGEFLTKKENEFLQNQIRFRAIGDITKFEPSLQSKITHLQEATQACTGLNLLVGLNYGGKDEIVRAVRKLVEKKQEITQENITQNLDTAGFGEVDLLIRTGGEARLSNFLLWQASYAELAFTTTLFPDFTKAELASIVQKFHATHRRFGGL